MNCFAVFLVTIILDAPIGFIAFLIDSDAIIPLKVVVFINTSTALTPFVSANVSTASNKSVIGSEVALLARVHLASVSNSILLFVAQLPSTS